MEILLIQFLTFVSAMLFVLSLARLGRAPGATAGSRLPGVFGLLGSEAEAVGWLFARGLSAWMPGETERFRRQLQVAALDRSISLRHMRGMQVVLAVGAFLLGTLFTLAVTIEAVPALVVGFLAVPLGYVYPGLWLNRVSMARQEQMRRELPFAIDLITVAMKAGQDFGSAVRNFVQSQGTGPMVEEFRIMLDETTRLNKDRVEALRSMADRIQLDEFRQVISAVVQSRELGASAVDALKVQAEEIRRLRYHRAERRAARAPSLMLMPVALFILPAVFIVVLTPIGIRLFGALSHSR